MKTETKFTLSLTLTLNPMDRHTVMKREIGNMFRWKV